MIEIKIPSAIVVDILKPKVPGHNGELNLQLRATLAQAPEHHVFHTYDQKLSLSGNYNAVALKLMRQLGPAFAGQWSSGKVGATVVYVNDTMGPGVCFDG